MYQRRSLFQPVFSLFSHSFSLLPFCIVHVCICAHRSLLLPSSSKACLCLSALTTKPAFHPFRIFPPTRPDATLPPHTQTLSVNRSPSARLRRLKGWAQFYHHTSIPARQTRTLLRRNLDFAVFRYSYWSTHRSSSRVLKATENACLE
jgi:hypothetical protein